MRHLTDDELVLHYYGEEDRDLMAVERHLRTCARCAGAYEALARSLNAVTPPQFTGAIDDMPALRQMLRDRLHDPMAARVAGRGSAWRDATVAALIWMIPVLYPVSLQALFTTGQWAATRAALGPFVALALLWACAGPLLAAFALNRASVPRERQRTSTRLVVAGALVAATGPALFVLVRTVTTRMSLDAGLWAWYAVLAAGALCALVRWPTLVHSSGRGAVRLHGISAAVLTAFLFGHVINQALAFASPASYAAMRGVMRLASLYPVSYAVIVAGVTVQIVTGMIAGAKNVGPAAFRRHLQTASGWYLAAFLLMHVLAGLVLKASPSAAPVAAAGSFNLLASPRAVPQLPFLLLGVGAFLFHVGVYARLVALAYMAETSVRRWSYAGAAAAVVVVVSVGLSLCGIHL